MNKAMYIQDLIKEVKKALKEDDPQKIDYYYNLFQLFALPTVSSELALKLLLVEVSKQENRPFAMKFTFPQTEVSSEVVLRSLEKVRKDLYRPCLDVRKHRNFIVCFLSMLDKEGFKPLIELLSKFYGHEHLWFTDLFAE